MSLGVNDIPNAAPSMPRLMALRNRAQSWLLPAALILALILAGLSLWNIVFPPVKQPVGVYVPAAPAPAVARVETVAAPIRTGAVQTYKPAAKKALKLPAALQAAQEEQVLAASTVQPDTHAYTLTTLVNTETGAVQTLQRRDPLPWLARDASGRLDLLIGQSDEGPVARLAVQQNLFQIKALRLGVAAALTQHIGADPETDWLVGINLGTSW